MLYHDHENPACDITHKPSSTTTLATTVNCRSSITQVISRALNKAVYMYKQGRTLKASNVERKERRKKVNYLIGLFVASE